MVAKISFRYLLPGMVVAAVIAACGENAIAPTPPPAPTATVAAATSTPAPTPTPVPGEWTPVAPMLAGRANHAAVPLPDGSVLVFGGVGQEGFVTASEIYRPESGEWELAAEMVAPNQPITPPIILSDGRVVVVGSTSDASPSKQVQAFDPSTGEWAAMPDLPVARLGPFMAALPDSSLLIGGGTGQGDVLLDTAIRYDDDNSSWKETEAVPFEVAQDTTSILFNWFNQNLPPWGQEGQLVVGMSFRELSGRLAWFNPTTGTWQELESGSIERRGATTGVLSDGRVIVFGGVDGNFTGLMLPAEIYDPATGERSPARSPEATEAASQGTLGRYLGNLPDGRSTFALMELTDPLSAAIGLYSPDTDSWENFEMPVWLDGMAVVMLPDSRILATGGKFGLFDYEPSAWVFVPPTR